MIPALDYSQVCDVLTQAFLQYDEPRGESVRMTGLLFARPTSPLAAAQIVPNLPYFHTRSGKNIHFFCAGYAMAWPFNWAPDKERVATINGMYWEFSEQSFADFVQEMRARTNWVYSGGVDLLLTNARFNSQDKTAYLDFESMLSCPLEVLEKKQVITNVEIFFEDIFRYAEEQDGNDPTWGFSKQQASSTFSDSLKRLLLSLLPKKIGKDIDRLAAYEINAVGKVAQIRTPTD